MKLEGYLVDLFLYLLDHILVPVSYNVSHQKVAQECVKNDEIRRLSCWLVIVCYQIGDKFFMNNWSLQFAYALKFAFWTDVLALTFGIVTTHTLTYNLTYSQTHAQTYKGGNSHLSRHDNCLIFTLYPWFIYFIVTLSLYVASYIYRYIWFYPLILYSISCLIPKINRFFNSILPTVFYSPSFIYF